MAVARASRGRVMRAVLIGLGLLLALSGGYSAWMSYQDLTAPRSQPGRVVVVPPRVVATPAP